MPRLPYFHDPAALFFGSTHDRYSSLTLNDEGYPIMDQGVSFPTAMHHYLWQKFSDPILQNRILQSPTASLATQVAAAHRSLQNPDMYDRPAMTATLSLKIKDPAIRDLILSTGTRPLIYHDATDTYWGDGGDGRGWNLLGELWMALRALI